MGGCLPRYAISRQDELPSDRYVLSATFDVQTSGPAEVPAFSWQVSGALRSGYSRSFRDGSVGRVVDFPTLSAAPSELAPALPTAAFVELRAFPDSVVLSVDGLDAYAGRAGAAESFDLLWPMLAPGIPTLRPGAPSTAERSFVLALDGYPPVRFRDSLTWNIEQRDGDRAHLHYQGTQTIEGLVSGTGTIEGWLVIGWRDHQIYSHRVVVDRSLQARWPAGVLTQVQRISIELTNDGEMAPLPLDIRYAADNPLADAEPLRLVDGRTTSDRLASQPGSLPFFLVPLSLAPSLYDRLTLAE